LKLNKLPVIFLVVFLMLSVFFLMTYLGIIEIIDLPPYVKLIKNNESIIIKKETETIRVINNSSENVAVTAAYYCNDLGKEDKKKEIPLLVSDNETQFPIEKGFLIVIRVFHKRGHKIKKRAFDFR